MSLVGGDWWGAILWSGAPVATYHSYAQSISRTPVTLVQIYIDYCGRTFGVAPCDGAGVACYNTYCTCKNPASYQLTKKLLEYVSVNTGTPFHQGERPYVMDIDYLPTEIKDSLAISGRLKIRLADEPDTDYGVDPYITTRTLPRPGMYWKKFLARNPNYQGRAVKIWEGWYGNDRGVYQLRWQGLLDNIVYDKDHVIMECIDPVKPMSDYYLPEQMQLSLVYDLSTLATNMSVKYSSQMSTYTYFRLDDEVVTVNSRNTAIDTVYITRGKFNTEVDEHSQGVKLEPIWHRGPENPFDTMLYLLSYGNLSSVTDTTSFDAAKNWPGDDKDVEVYINTPKACDKLLYELADYTNCRIWYGEEQKIKCKRISANNPDSTYLNISDRSNIIEQSASVDYKALDRITRYWMYWGQSPIGTDNDATSYAYLTGAIDADSESSFHYGSIKEQTIYSRWNMAYTTEMSTGHKAHEARAKSYVQRMLFNRRDPLPMLDLKVELKDSTILTGDYVIIDTDEIENSHGAHSNNKYIITRREVIGDGVVALKAQALPTRNIAVIAPSTIAADWSAASTTERLYAYISDSSGYMSDQDTLGYHIY